MKKMLAALSLVVLLAVPAGAAATPDDTDKRAAKAECKAERGKTRDSRAAFKLKHGSMSRCVKKTTLKKNAAKECKAERADPGFAADHDGKSFEQHYGTNANGKNAFGKCVSQRTRGDSGSE